MTTTDLHHAEYACPECDERAYFDRPAEAKWEEKWTLHMYHDHDEEDEIKSPVWRFVLRKERTRQSEGFKALTEGKAKQRKRLVDTKRANKVAVDPGAYAGWWDIDKNAEA